MKPGASSSRRLRLVPPPRGRIDADMVAFNVMEFIDSEFPEMLRNATLIARARLRNKIISAVCEQERKS